MPDQLTDRSSEIDFSKLSNYLSKFGNFSFEQTADSLVLVESVKNKTIKYQIDIDAFIKQIRSYPVAKKAVFNQALGKRSRTVLDATAGWGGDLLRIWSQGYRVIGLEQNPVLNVILKDAMRKLGDHAWTLNLNLDAPEIVACNSIEFLQSQRELLETVDVIYLDPMFGEKRKKSAVSNKYMELLKRLLDEQAPSDNNEALVRAAIESPCKRVVVKRPNYASHLYREPDEQYSSKLIHFDVYLN